MAHGLHFPVASLAEAFRAPAHSPATNRPVLLIVDDEPLIVESLSAILYNAGFAILKAYDGASALDLARTIPPDLLITDVAMPGMDGIELGIAIVNSIPDCGVLLFSAHAQSRDLDAARQAGFNFPLLTKPVHPRTMLRNIHECLRDRVHTHRVGAGALSLALAS